MNNTETTIKTLLIISLSLGIINGALNLHQTWQARKSKKCNCQKCQGKAATNANKV